MPDISMCKNNMCVFNETCYRYKAKPNLYQSYGEFEPEITGDTLECEYYWPYNIDMRSGKLEFTPELYRELKEHYNMAVEEDREQFVFYTSIFLTSYAKYLLEYLKDRYESDYEST